MGGLMKTVYLCLKCGKPLRHGHIELCWNCSRGAWTKMCWNVSVCPVCERGERPYEVIEPPQGFVRSDSEVCGWCGEAKTVRVFSIGSRTNSPRIARARELALADMEAT